MYSKAVFALAAVFLAVAIVVPILVLSLQAQNDLERLIIIQNPSGMETDGNSTALPDIAEIRASHQTSYLIAGFVAAVFVALFVVTLYYGINHVNPIHSKPK
ncbi:MAG: hypothetical protein NWE96_03365 [Candidatus Bathyarchaeota archaeon]|nr:hypothetical protein [Candidatus Bathyarchaeota archaeon]